MKLKKFLRFFSGFPLFKIAIIFFVFLLSQYCDFVVSYCNAANFLTSMLVITLKLYPITLQNTLASK